MSGKALFIFIGLLVLTTHTHGQSDCSPKFKDLIEISKKSNITQSDFLDAVKIVKELEQLKCVDYVVKRNNEDFVETGRTGLFGEISIKVNNRLAVKEYIKYMNRNSGSAEEAISFEFEELFVKQPEVALASINGDQNLLDQLVWGFVNNHYKLHLTPNNAKTFFYKINPQAKLLYPKYKKSIDYLLKGYC